MLTSVANIRSLPPGWERDRRFVYVGRAGHGFDGTWGNPFVVNPTAGIYREQVIARFRAWLWERIQNDPQFARDLMTLRGRTLVCFCAPKACHGDVLAAAAEYLDHREHCEPGAPCTHELKGAHA
jgi:hypothetical protein